MAKHRRTWVVVADGARARFLTPNEEATGLVPAVAESLASNEAHGFARDLKSDKPGRSFNSVGGIRHAIEPQHDYHKMEKHKFAAELAKILTNALARHEFDRLVLIAPKRSLGELRLLLPQNVQARIRKEIPKDLTKSEPGSLWTLVSPLVRPSRLGAD
jgi:protein required for attachment to host cells